MLELSVPLSVHKHLPPAGSLIKVFNCSTINHFTIYMHTITAQRRKILLFSPKQVQKIMHTLAAAATEKLQKIAPPTQTLPL